LRCEKGVVPDCCTNTDWRKTELSRASASESARRSERTNWLICNAQYVDYLPMVVDGGFSARWFSKRQNSSLFGGVLY
jgi:hypothetical protein